MSISRWSSWASLGALALLTLATAIWSVSTSSTGTQSNAIAIATSPSSATAPPGARLTANPRTVGPGQPFRLSGTGCPRTDRVITGWNGPVTPKSDGSWNVVVGGRILLVGTVNVGAACVERRSRSEVFGYPPVRILVTPLPPGARITVSPKVVMIGQSIRLSGNDCFPPTDYVLPAYGDAVTPKPDGSWSAGGVVGDGAQVGFVPVSAACVTGADKAEVFSYPAVHIQVKTYRHLRVTPGTTVSAGTTLTVFSIGACPSRSEGDVYLQSAVAPETDVAQSFAINSSSGGEWSATLPIPQGTAPGHYMLHGQCDGDHVFLAFYSAVPITVTIGSSG